VTRQLVQERVARARASGEENIIHGMQRGEGIIEHAAWVFSYMPSLSLCYQQTYTNDCSRLPVGFVFCQVCFQSPVPSAGHTAVASAVAPSHGLYTQSNRSGTVS
jgi:hypothetical protein